MQQRVHINDFCSSTCNEYVAVASASTIPYRINFSILDRYKAEKVTQKLKQCSGIK